MIKHIKSLIGIVLSFSVMSYAIDTNPVQKDIINVDSKFISFDASGLQVGQSGIVITRTHDYNVIIANAEITRIEDDTAYARWTSFNSIKQKYLPTPIRVPQVDDIALFGGFYNKAIAIAPDQEHYIKILSQNTQVEFMHIDVFSAFLAKDGINDPKPKHFQAFCNIYSVGLVYIFASNGINVLDCQSFAILQIQDEPTPTLSQTYAPFFSRIANIDTGSLASKLRSKKSRTYLPYYDELLKESLSAFYVLQNTAKISQKEE